MKNSLLLSVLLEAIILQLLFIDVTRAAGADMGAVCTTNVCGTNTKPCTNPGICECQDGKVAYNRGECYFPMRFTAVSITSVTTSSAEFSWSAATPAPQTQYTALSLYRIKCPSTSTEDQEVPANMESATVQFTVGILEDVTCSIAPYHTVNSNLEFVLMEAPLEFTIKPKAKPPTGGTVTPLSTGGVRVVWIASPSSVTPAHYQVSCATETVQSVTSNSATLPNMEPHKQVSCDVTVEVPGYPASDKLTIIVKSQAKPPTGGTVTPLSTGGVRVEWIASPSSVTPAHYQVYCATETVQSVTSTSATLPNMEPNKQVSCDVTVKVPGYPASDKLTIIVKSPPPPVTNGGVSSVPGDTTTTSAKIKWTNTEWTNTGQYTPSAYQIDCTDGATVASGKTTGDSATIIGVSGMEYTCNITVVKDGVQSAPLIIKGIKTLLEPATNLEAKSKTLKSVTYQYTESKSLANDGVAEDIFCYPGTLDKATKTVAFNQEESNTTCTVSTMRKGFITATITVKLTQGLPLGFACAKDVDCADGFGCMGAVKSICSCPADHYKTEEQTCTPGSGSGNGNGTTIASGNGTTVAKSASVQGVSAAGVGLLLAALLAIV